MKKIDRHALQLLRPQIEEALRALADKHDLAIKVGNASYDVSGNNASFKLELSTRTADGTINTREADDYKKYAKLYGYDPDKLGAIVTLNRKQYKIKGLLVKSRRFPISAEEVSTGKMFKLPDTVVLATPLAKAGA